MAVLLDTHYHLDFVTAPGMRAALVSELARRGVGIVAQTLLPTAFAEQISGSRQATCASPQKSDGALLSPLLSLGFHPWWIVSEEQVEAELALMSKAVGKTRFIGEIGLDFAPRRVEQAPEQLQIHVLRRILEEVCAAAGVVAEGGVEKPYVLSIHTVRSATAVLDLLEELDVASHNVVPVFHRFAGTSDELTRLVKLGGFLSVHPQVLATKRGRAYVKQTPGEQLLLETDLPKELVRESGDGGGCEDFADSLFVRTLADDVEASLCETLKTLSELRKEDMESIILRTQSELYGVS